jgi:hypothetical protein
MMVCGTSSDGIVAHVKAVPSDGPPLKSGEWDILRKAYGLKGLHTTHGFGGMGFYGCPVPWNVSPEIDSYLIKYGHTKPS